MKKMSIVAAGILIAGISAAGPQVEAGELPGVWFGVACCDGETYQLLSRFTDDEMKAEITRAKTGVIVQMVQSSWRHSSASQEEFLLPEIDMLLRIIWMHDRDVFIAVDDTSGCWAVLSRWLEDSDAPLSRAEG